MKVYLATEGTYPFVVGGVSTWADLLLRGLPQHQFQVAAVVDNPFHRLAFSLPPNVELQPVPLWGLEMAEEYLALPGSWRRALRTSSREVRTRFLPCWEPFVGALAAREVSPDALGDALAGVAHFAERYDLRRALASPATWAVLESQFRANALMARTSTQGAVEFGRALFRFLLPLCAPVPRCDVAHTSAAGLCALPAIVAKYRYGTPVLLTEHGIYLRERVLGLSHLPLEEKFLMVNFYRAVTELAYREADLLAPVCEYNGNWEVALGVDRHRVRVVHNGFSSAQLAGLPPSPPGGPPTIGFVGRIDPLKDVLTLVRAFNLVHKQLPNARLRFWGPATSAAYLQECQSEAASHDLFREGSSTSPITFEGRTNDIAGAYGSCHVVALSSVTEGFPYTVVEAMLAARPVVASDVGGVSEALSGVALPGGSGGLLVDPGDPQAMARSLLSVLQADEKDRLAVGLALRARAQERFGVNRCLSAYDEIYQQLGSGLRAGRTGSGRGRGEAA